MSSEFFNIIPHEVLCQHVREYPGATKDGRDVELRLAVKEYVPKKPLEDEGVTIIAAGGNGFPKVSKDPEEEMYEPLWDDILNSLRMKGVTIRSIWTADMANQGRSSELNEGRIGTDYSWMDHSRDLLALVNHFRESIKPPVIGIGHSIGANALINLSLFHTRLFTDLILYEPILGYVADDGTRFDCTAEGVHFARLAGKHPSSWPSRQVAEDAMSNAKPFVDFDARVLSRWFAQGLRSSTIGEEAVELVTSKLQEAATYVRPLFDPQVENSPGKAGNQLDRTTYPDYDESVTGLRSFYCPESWRTFTRLPEIQSRALFVFRKERNVP
ncbi:hypothetical protein PRZ48_008018 [Zasmidium cellare]|uniref:AB hydrolase-1 domain-containing protein n=1 Tax=Zasmidium cellare TaxID=395010 RepID=A0ABR0EED0_ZASCE|nr:hypothetical protein PRZ48_008018 [Zasmidium cellare]